MVTFVTAKSSITAVTAAALLAGLMAFLASAVPEAKAESTGSVRATHAKGDRVPTRVTGAACSAQSWPNYDVACQFDHRRPPSEAQAVRRVIALR